MGEKETHQSSQGKTSTHGLKYNSRGRNQIFSLTWWKAKVREQKLKALGLFMRILTDRIWGNSVFIPYNYTIIKLCQKCKIYWYKLLNRTKCKMRFACGIIH